MVRVLDKDGVFLFELDEQVFPLRMPLETKMGEKVYHLHIYWEEDDKTKVRSAQLNTRP